MGSFKEITKNIETSWMPIDKCEKNVKLKEDKIPKDTFYLVHLLCLLMGMLNLLPLTFFVTASGYWMYKFRDVEKDVVDLNNKTTLQKYFVSGSMVVQTVPSVLTMLLSTGFGHKIKVNLRIIGTLSFISCIFIIFTIFIKVNTDTWQVAFFITTFIGLFLITGVLNLFQVSSMVVVPRFPAIYMKTFLLGQGFASMFSAILQIMSLALGTSTLTSALVYFISGTSTILLTLLLYICVQKTTFYNHYIGEDVDNTKKKHSKEELKTVFLQIWPCVAVLVILFLTRSVSHPSVTSLVVSENYNRGSEWSDVYFVPTITFLFTETCGQIGRLLARPIIKKSNAPWLIGLTVLRMVVIVPLFIFCNAQPRDYLPVLLPHDWQYILICFVFFSSGAFLLASTFLSIQKLTDKEDVAFLIMMSCLGMSAGIFSPLSVLAVRIL